MSGERPGPTVVFEAGFSLLSLSWKPVLDRLDGGVMAVAYDRACTGWSDHGEHPRVAAKALADLHRLLHTLGTAPPYVLVGHSLGATLALRFAAAFPTETAGLVLVDGAHPRQREEFTPVARLARVTDALKWNAYRRRLLLRARLHLLAKVPPSGDAWTDQWLATLCQDRPAGTVGWLRCEVPSLPRSLEAATLPTRPPIPIEVLWALPDEAAPHWTVPDTQRAWREEQEEMAALSPQGRATLVDNSSHDMPTDRPDAIADAILRVII